MIFDPAPPLPATLNRRRQRRLLCRVGTLHSRVLHSKMADVFTAVALLVIAFVAFATGFEPQFNGPFAIASVVLLFLGAITDCVWRRFRAD
jgi:uncharacterized membrane protein YoaK (UPF0700 family)